MTTLLAPRLRIKLDAAKAFTLTTQAKATVGYIFAWSFDSGIKLDADLSVPDPENPSEQKKVVAILGLPENDVGKEQFWQGGRTDPADYWGILSFKNRAKLLNVMHAPAGGTEQTVSTGILVYDEDKKEYFEYHAYEDLPAIFTPDFECDVGTEPYAKYQPPTYFFHVSLSPKGNAPQHEIRCAESPSDKVIAKWGGVGA